MSSKPSFIVTYEAKTVSHLFALPTFPSAETETGGYQEYSTAAQAVKAIFPGSKIQQNQTDNYPPRVTVSAVLDGKETVDIWSGPQRDLFRKYAAQRTKSIQAIQANLKDFKEEY